MFDVSELGLEAGGRLDEDVERLEQSNDVRADAVRWTKVDNLDRQAAPDSIEAADALYGVTVGDDSVSRVISLRLDEAQALASERRELSAAG